MYVRGDTIEILPAFQDEGDGQYLWVCVTDEEKGRVDISPIGTGLAFPPVYSVQSSWICSSPCQDDACRAATRPQLSS